MTSTKQICDVLKNHEIFEILKEEEGIQNDSKERADQLMHIDGSNLFVWSNHKSCLYTSNLRSAIDDDASMNIQMLMCEDASLFKVCSILFDASHNYVALVGSKRVAVVTLPRRWGHNGQFEGGKKKITCRCFYVAERLFTTNLSVQLLQASWYPTTSNPHLCLLTSDNTLQIFNIESNQEVPVQRHKLNKPTDANTSISASRVSLVSMYSALSGLGETVKAFAFAPAIEHKPKGKTRLGKAHREVMLDAIYLLQGNGDVLLLLLSLTENSYSDGILFGPLIMLPAAEDNYGVESCSIHVMGNSPAIVVIATAAGKLHHCVALWSNDKSEAFDSQSSIITKSEPPDLTPPVLCVYESVELELDLTMEENEAESRLITLHKDPALPFRYHCCTSVGVHSVVLPWMRVIDNFVGTDDDNMQGLAVLANDDPCTVEHVLCTRPTSSSAVCPVIGFTIATDPLVGLTLVCLTADKHCLCVNLLKLFHPPPIPLMSDNVENARDKTQLKPSQPDFEEHVREILKREVSQPIIRAGDWDKAADSKQCLQLVARATNVLRTEYILKQRVAREAIAKKVAQLSEMKAQQTNELMKLDQLRSSLKETAEQISTDYEDCSDRQQQLLERLNRVVKYVNDRNPVLSDAEESMGKELKTLQEKLLPLGNKIKQLKIKFEYQKKLKANGDSGYIIGRGGANETVNRSLQTEQFKTILLDEGEKIHELIKKINNMNIQVGN